MIHVSHFTKRYAGRVVVDDISFAVEKGEIVGFLGPNGAGKTTTMRVLTGYLPASGGEVRVAGHDVSTHPLEVRKRIGYLPENCPLYPEMRVDEYLKFRARLKGVTGRKVRTRVDEVKEQCGLTEVRRRIIGQLSKGYRQRVGLAESLVHEPELLILDEPTIGLDPNQIRQVRALIKDLATRHTILLSTHILPEVELICKRVLIINQGRVVASDSPERLRIIQGPAPIRAQIRGPKEGIEAALRGIPGVLDVECVGSEPWWNFTVTGEEETIDLGEAVYACVKANDWSLRELSSGRRTLEDVFVHLTRTEAAR